ncbi:MAG: hypothetical protein AAB439_01405 [Patescibacteria group bacterium]
MTRIGPDVFPVAPNAVAEHMAKVGKILLTSAMLIVLSAVYGAGSLIRDVDKMIEDFF